MKLVYVTLVAKKLRPFVYGVARSSSGKLYSFCVRRGRELPLNIVEMSSMNVANGSDAQAAADRLLESLLSDPTVLVSTPPPIAELTPTLLKPGSTAIHNDQQGSHASIILWVEGDQARALFLTTRPSWGGVSRKATFAEMVILGLSGQRVSYLVPVIRHVADFFPRGTVSDLHLQELRQEFSGAFGTLMQSGARY